MATISLPMDDGQIVNISYSGNKNGSIYIYNITPNIGDLSTGRFPVARFLDFTIEDVDGQISIPIRIVQLPFNRSDIIFYVDNIPFASYSNQTWIDWINTSYCPSENGKKIFSIDSSNMIRYKENKLVLYENYSSVKPNDIIQNITYSIY